MKRVLITGIDSFTGKHLKEHLRSAGYDVYGTSFFESKSKVYRCDISKKEDLVSVLGELQPEYVIHLAGISFVAHGSSRDFYEVNVLGAFNLLESLCELSLNPKKIILASSATVYGNQKSEVLDESLCPHPANHYGASKYAMESMARTFFDKLRILIVRPFNYTGVGQSKNFLIPKIVEHFKEGRETIELGNIDVSREFNDVSFVCEVYSRLLESDAKSETLNIASSRAVSLLEVLKLMEQIAGYKIKRETNPLFVRSNEISTLIGSSKKLFSYIDKIENRALIETLKEMYE